MARVYTYTLIAIGLMVFMQIMGLPTGIQPIANVFKLATGDITASDFFLGLFGSLTGILITAGLATGGIIAGLFTRSQPENYILLPLITGTLAALAGTFISVINATYAAGIYPDFIGNIILLILAPFTVGYILSLAEFFRGTA